MRRPWLVVLVLVVAGGVAALVSVDRAAPVNGPAPETAPSAAPPEAARPIVQSTFTVTVMDDAKTPVAKATVHLHHGFDATTSVYRESVSAVTDDAGVARFALVVSGDAVVLRAERGSEAGWSAKVPVRGAESVERTILVGQAYGLHGRVARAAPGSTKLRGWGEGLDDAKAISGAVVVVNAHATESGARDTAELVRFGVTTDWLGNFRLPPVRWSGRTERMSFEIAAPGFADARFSLPRSAPSRGGWLGTTLLAPPRAVRGRVVDLSGKPFPAAEVAIDDSDFATRTNSDGEFLFPNVANTALRLRIGGPMRQWERLVSVAPGGAADLGSLELGAAPPTSGRVLDDEGRPLPNADVMVMQCGEALPLRSVRTDGDGRFTFRDTPAGEFVLVARPGEGKNRSSTLTEPVATRGGAADVELRLAAPATMSLTVVNAATGAPIATGPVEVSILDALEGGDVSENTRLGKRLAPRLVTFDADLAASPVRLSHRVVGRAQIVVTAKSQSGEFRLFGKSGVVEFRSGQTTELTVKAEVDGE